LRLLVEVCLYDRKGVTEKAFKRLGLDFRPVRSASELKGEEVLVVGRRSLDKELFREGGDCFLLGEKERMSNRLTRLCFPSGWG